MSGLLIDDSGKVWPAQPETVARRFGLRYYRDFMVRALDLGFVSAAFGGYGARIALRPELVSQAALSRLLDMVGQHGPRRVALAGDGRLSSWEFIIGAQRSITRIEHLSAEARNPSPRPLLTAQRLPLERCQDIARGWLIPVLQMWEEAAGQWKPEFHERLRKMRLLEQTTIVSQEARSERLLVEHLGIRNSLFGRDWARIAPGRTLEDAPNGDIGRWRTKMMRQEIACGKPALSNNDLVFRDLDRRLVRSRSVRLGLPWRKSGKTVLVTATDVARHRVLLELPNRAN